jgi:hypothetical protein
MKVDKKNSLRLWQLIQNFFICQSLYDVKQKDQLELCVPLAIRFLITLTKVAEKNLRAYKDISNETICSQINLAGQYLLWKLQT